MRKLFIDLILKNLDKKTIIDKLLKIKNKTSRKYYHSLLVYFFGFWNRGEPLEGKGTVYQENNYFRGEWNNSLGEGLINKVCKLPSELNTELIFTGQFYMKPYNGEGSFNLSNNIMNSIYEGVWQENKFNGKILNTKYKTEFIGEEISEESFIGNGVLVYNDRLYKGDWQDGMGKGSIISIYEGKEYTFKGVWNSFGFILNGEGTIIEDDSRYIGKWINSENKGEIISLYGDVFKGEWDDFFWPIEGEGVYVSSKSVKYIGTWKAGCGQGRVVSGDNFSSVYIGSWNRHGHFIEGIGVLQDYDGNKYQGKWDSKTEKGEGIIKFANGQELNAKWDCYRRISDGKGIYYDKSLRKYDGVYQNGNGRGIIYSLDYLKYEGTWDIDGFPIDGEGYFISDGVLFKGKWTNSCGNGHLYS